MVPVTGGARAEIRKLAMGEVPAESRNPEKVPGGDLSSFSRVRDAAHIPDLAEVVHMPVPSMHRRHMADAMREAVHSGVTRLIGHCKKARSTA